MNFKNFFVIAGTLVTSLCLAETASAGGGYGHGHGRGHRGYNAPVVIYNAPHGGRGYGGGYRRGYERCDEGGRGHGWGHRRHYNPTPVVIYNQGYDRGYSNYGYERPYYDSGVGFNINLGGRL